MAEQVDAAEHWRTHAAQWIAWARSPDHDAYWFWNSTFFDHIVPSPGRLTLEMGCGEGRVVRDLAARGHSVVGVDLVAALVHEAMTISNGAFVNADAVFLPFPNETFDIAIAHNSLMDVDDLQGAVLELARVLAPGGYLCICVVHPLFDAGRFENVNQSEVFVIRDAYLDRRPFNEVYSWNGRQMPFRGWSYPLQDYFSAIEHADLLVDRVREPLPKRSPSSGQFGEQRWNRVPLFLHIRAVKPAR